VGGSQGTRPPASGPQRTLASLLETAFGGVEAARGAIAQALATAGREELPTAGPELLAFVRAYLLEPLSDHVGPRLTMALMDDLVAELDPDPVPAPPPSTIPPPSVPRPVGRIAMHPQARPRLLAVELGVLLVDPDRVGRTSLARALLRGRSNVTLVDTVEDLAAVINAGDVVDAALIDVTHPGVHTIVEVLVRHRPDVVVLARSRDAGRTRALLAQLGVTRCEVRSREAPAEELIDALRRLVAG